MCRVSNTVGDAVASIKTHKSDRAGSMFVCGFWETQPLPWAVPHVVFFLPQTEAAKGDLELLYQKIGMGPAAAPAPAPPVPQQRDEDAAMDDSDNELEGTGSKGQNRATKDMEVDSDSDRRQVCLAAKLLSRLARARRQSVSHSATNDSGVIRSTKGPPWASGSRFRCQKRWQQAKLCGLRCDA